jgi:hypothetical protein
MSRFRRVSAICILTLLSNPLWAAQLRFIMDGFVVPEASTWLPATPLPATTQVSFILDTQSFGSLLIEPLPPGGAGAPCVGHFNATGLAISNIVVSADQGILWTSSSASGSTRGTNAGGQCPGDYFSSIAFTDGDTQFGWSFDASPGSLYADVTASADPLLEILLGFTSFGDDGGSLTGNWGTLTGGYAMQSVQAVPGPPAVWLLGTALAALGGRGWRRRTAA